MAAGGNNISFPTVSTTGGGYWLTLHDTEGGPMLSLDYCVASVEGDTIPLHMTPGPSETFMGHNQQYIFVEDDADASEVDTVTDTSVKIEWIVQLPRIRVESNAQKNYVQLVEIFYRVKKFLSTAIGISLSSTTVLDSDDGTEKLTNGTFTGAATGWTLGTGWAYGTNNVNHSGASAGNLSQGSLDIDDGNIYKLVYTVSGYSGSATMTPSVGGTNGTSVSADGTYTEYIASGSTKILNFAADANFVGTVDSVSLKRGGIAETKTSIVSSGNRYFKSFGSGFDVMLYDLSSGTPFVEELDVTLFNPSEE